MLTPIHAAQSDTHRAAADQQGHNGVAQQAVAANTNVAQCYFDAEYESKPARLSENKLMWVTQNGGRGEQYFYAHPDIPTAHKVLTPVKTLDDGAGTKIYQHNVHYEDDCGVFAMNVQRKLHDFKRREETDYYEVHNAEGGKKVGSKKPTDYWGETPAAPAAPGLGDLYMVINDPAYKKSSLTSEQYNWHWATVVAKEGNDVMTVEAAPGKDVQFQVYSQSEASQSFQEHYVKANLLMSTAKTFYLSHHTEAIGK